MQNYKFYGKSALCPCCGLYDETLQHVFACNTPEVVEFRRKQQDILWAQLDLINTPSHVEADIKQGILSLEVESQATDLVYCTPAALAQADLTWSAFCGAESVFNGNMLTLTVTHLIEPPVNGLVA
jgi:hypothetical protein